VVAVSLARLERKVVALEARVRALEKDNDMLIALLTNSPESE